MKHSKIVRKLIAGHNDISINLFIYLFITVIINEQEERRQERWRPSLRVRRIGLHVVVLEEDYGKIGA